MLGPILAELIGRELSVDEARDAFLARFYNSWLDWVYERDATLRRFGTDAHERLIEQFRLLVLRDTVLASVPFEVVTLVSIFLVPALGTLAVGVYNGLADLVEDRCYGFQSPPTPVISPAVRPALPPSKPPVFAVEPVAEPMVVPRPRRPGRVLPPPREEPPRRRRIVEVLPGSLSPAGVRFYCDECANGLGPVLERRGLDVLTSREAGMDGTKDDRQQLLLAQRERRILITYNAKDFRRLDGVVPHAGMLLCPQGREFVQEIVRVCLRIAEDGLELRSCRDDVGCP